MEKSYYKALSISYTHLALSHSFQAKAFAVLGNSDQEQFYQRLSVDAERLSDRYIQKLQEVE